MGLWSITAQNVIAQDTDPGAVGAGVIWTDTNANLTYRRNDANSGWNVIGSDTLVSAAEYAYLDGVTSALQTQLDAKQATLTGLTASVTELNYTDGVTSSIQTQIDNIIVSKLIGHAGFSFAGAATKYFSLYSSDTAGAATEAPTQIKVYFAFTLKRLTAIVTSVPNTNSTCALRDDGIDITSLTLTASTAGEYDSGVITGAVTSGSKLGWYIVANGTGNLIGDAIGTCI